MIIYFEVIEAKSGSNSYPSLVNQPWGRNMNANISLEKERIQIKGKCKRVIIPHDPTEERPWDETNDDDAYVKKLYQIMQKNEGTIKPNSNEQIHLGSPISIKQNSN